MALISICLILYAKQGGVTRLLFSLFKQVNVAVNVFCAREMSQAISVGHFQKYRNTLCLSSKICISITFTLSWDHCKSQEKMETMLMQNFGGQAKSIMVFLKVAYCAVLIIIIFLCLIIVFANAFTIFVLWIKRRKLQRTWIFGTYFDRNSRTF